MVLGAHTTLKSMKLSVTLKYPLVDLGLTKFLSLTELIFVNYLVSNVGPGLLPTSLTSLTIRLLDIPPRDTFLSLTLLVHLEIQVHRESIDPNRDEFIDLEDLPNLKTLIFDGDNDIVSEGDNQPITGISVPMSLKILKLRCNRSQIPSRCVMPLLEKLYVNQIVFPPTLTHLSIMGLYEPIQLPESLVKLKQMINQASIPRQLKKLVWANPHIGWETNKSQLKLPSSNDYPPNLETLNLNGIEDDFKFEVPQTIKYLSISLTHGHNLMPYNQQPLSIFSISSKIITISQQQQQQQQQWLPHNTTHLTCDIRSLFPALFRLDEVINHTNVSTLHLSNPHFLFNFTIQRLDADNRNVLVFESQFLIGGIITQQRKTNSQQYDPIYVYLDPLPSSSSPFELRIYNQTLVDTLVLSKE
ncbi:hypothetical protein DFA_08331 [Cavenderia fasciculata]|uniref:Uncharacterized protein n=1 Tax=Cavenderia fasciculata TaxID=261658 RepID=F4Q5S7_CACFS|nr:uncharacterized protein DFA_08331 [Cavenderia fasciculata]EGG17336.1 hypothetical protein DFA_08331 [Cavenderia fasciculata]|eukprot:XP_004355820.1 hypothetical protein DFA_08331 [Cavenderia fasciculata]